MKKIITLLLITTSLLGQVRVMNNFEIGGTGVTTIPEIPMYFQTPYGDTIVSSIMIDEIDGSKEKVRLYTFMYGLNDGLEYYITINFINGQQVTIYPSYVDYEGYAEHELSEEVVFLMRNYEFHFMSFESNIKYIPCTNIADGSFYMKFLNNYLKEGY